MKTQTKNLSQVPPYAKVLALAFVWASPLLMIACGPGEKAAIETRETQSAEKAIESYADKASDEAKGDVDVAFAALDKEIAELEARVATTEGEKRAEAEAKLEELKQRRGELKGDYNKAKFDALVEEVKNAVR